MSTINHNVLFCSFLPSDDDVSEDFKRWPPASCTETRTPAVRLQTLHLKSAMGNDTLSEAASHFVRVGALCDWSSLVWTEQWDLQRKEKCKRRPPGRTFQTLVQARANKVSVTLAHARRLFLFSFFSFFHFSEPLVGPALCLWGSLSSSGCSVSALPFSMSLTLLLSLFLDFIVSLSLCRMSPFFATFVNQIQVSHRQPLLNLIRTASAVPASTNTLLSIRQTRLLCCWCNYVTIYFHCVSLPTLGC